MALEILSLSQQEMDKLKYPISAVCFRFDPARKQSPQKLMYQFSSTKNHLQIF